MPVYPDDEMISPKAPLSASAIRRLQNMHQGEAAQTINKKINKGMMKNSISYKSNNIHIQCKVNKHQNFKEGWKLTQ